jgi:hypothetical protein
MGNSVTCAINCNPRIAAILSTLDQVPFRNITVNMLKKVINNNTDTIK